MIDLHIHTNASDGELSAKELVDVAIENDLKIIEIGRASCRERV